MDTFTTNTNVPRHPGPGSIASSSYSNFRKQNYKFGSGGAGAGAGSGNAGNSYLYTPAATRATSFAKTTAKFFKFKVPVFFKRALKPPTLDFDKSIWEIFYLIFSPKKVYKSLYYHKYTKNYYHRDDPSFIILISFFLVISAVAWGITYNLAFVGILKLILYMVFVDFYITGVLVASVNWFLVNKFLRKTSYLSFYSSSSLQGSSSRTLFDNRFVQSVYAVLAKFGSIVLQNSGNEPNVATASSEETLEWAYCFDIHANSFLVIWINLYLLQFVLLPILVMNNFFSRLLANCLYLITLSYYCVNSFYGYNILPFLVKTEFILFPIPIFVVIWLVLTLSGFNMTAYMIESYFN